MLDSDVPTSKPYSFKVNLIMSTINSNKDIGFRSVPQSSYKQNQKINEALNLGIVNIIFIYTFI
jgi:hypothetical protein